jgi:hypothetical protein
MKISKIYSIVKSCEVDKESNLHIAIHENYQIKVQNMQKIPYCVSHAVEKDGDKCCEISLKSHITCRLILES